MPGCATSSRARAGAASAAAWWVRPGPTAAWRRCSTSANAVTGQLLTPLVSVNLARPRISHTFLGTQRFDFAGSAGDIYGRYIGYYFLNVFVWILAMGIAVAAVIAGGMQLGFTAEEVEKLATAPSLRTVLLLIAAVVVLYIVFGLMILPLRCWWQAYLLRYLVARTRAGNVLFASAISTRQMWGFMVLNYLIVVLTLGLGWPWVMHRTLRLIARELWIYGAPQGGYDRPAAAARPALRRGAARHVRRHRLLTMTTRARYYDGKVALAREVTVRPASHELLIIDAVDFERGRALAGERAGRAGRHRATKRRRRSRAAARRGGW